MRSSRPGASRAARVYLLMVGDGVTSAGAGHADEAAAGECMAAAPDARRAAQEFLKIR